MNLTETTQAGLMIETVVAQKTRTEMTVGNATLRREDTKEGAIYTLNDQELKANEITTKVVLAAMRSTRQ